MRKRGPEPGPSWGLGAVALAAALFALAGVVAGRLFDSGVAPIHLAEIRSTIAFAGLLLLPEARRAPRGRLHPGWVLGLGLSIALVTLSYYVAIDHLEVAVAIVLQYTGPALVVAWTGLVLRRRPSPSVVAALAAAIVGVVLVSEIPGRGLGEVDVVGLGAGLASALFFASYTLLSERLGSIYSPVAVMLRGFGIATCFWVLFQLPRGWPADVLSPANLPSVLFVGLGGTLLAFVLYVWGIARIRAERASIAATLEPVLAAAFAWVWLGESLSLMQISGGGLVLGAVVALQARRAQEPRRASAA